MKLLSTFEYKELKVETFYNGTSKVPNKTYLNGILVYEDETFRPSPLYNIDSPEVMVVLLWFLVLTSDAGVGEEYFEDRDAIELTKWAEESLCAEEIRMMVNDFEMREDRVWRVQNGLTKAVAGRIKKYIQ